MRLKVLLASALTMLASCDAEFDTDAAKAPTAKVKEAISEVPRRVHGNGNNTLEPIFMTNMNRSAGR